MENHHIVQLNGLSAGARYPVEDGYIIGRNPSCHIFLNNPLVSRQHARFRVNDSGAFVLDLQSGNGTLVDGRRIAEVKLSDGQVILIGETEFQFEEATPTSALTGLGDCGRIVLQDNVAGDMESSKTQDVYNTLFTTSSTNANSGSEAEQLQARLKAIYEANQIISSEHNLEKVFEKVTEQLLRLVSASNMIIMTVDQETGKLVATHEHKKIEGEAIQVSSTIIRQAFVEREAVLVSDAGADKRFDASQSIIMGDIASVICVPMQFRSEVLGVIYLDTRGSTNAFNNNDLELLVALAGPAAIAIQNASYHQQLEDDFQTTLKLLANAIEMRDHYTLGHTWRVTKYSIEIARELGWSEEKVSEVEMGGVLHDIGKIGVADAVLRKPERLNDDEYAQMKVHPERGAALMRDCKKLEALIPYCLYHHERYDGKGYPYGMEGEDIPIEGRLVAVADTFDAMTSNRSYRDALPAQVALDEIEKHKNTQFDPVCADAFIRAFHKGKIEPFMQTKQEDAELDGVACPFCSTFISIPEEAEEDDIYGCSVCHRSVKLLEQNGTFFGELLKEVEMRSTQPAKGSIYAPPN